MNPEDELRKAAEAQQLLDNPLFQAARKDLEDQWAQLRRTVPIGQTEMHTKLILMEQVGQRFFGYFEQLAQTGKFAQLNLQEEERKRASMMDRIRMFATNGRGTL